ncbi:isocitrate/isopropylmalate family dehydrogenase [Sphingobium scionense]
MRENSEGEYSQIGGAPAPARMKSSSSRQYSPAAAPTGSCVTPSISRASLAVPHVTSATKSNGLYHSMPFWDERFAAIGAEYPGIATDQYHIDILAARFVMSPERFDVVVGSNLFGDILSDLGPGVTGTIAVAPSANLNPSRRYPSMFEPVHGSAPDIAGQGIANPIGQIWSGAMMLDHLGEAEAAAMVLAAIEAVLRDPQAVLTPDLGGNGSTAVLTRQILEKLQGR